MPECLLLSPAVLQLGYISSWSSLAAYRRRHPQAPDPLLGFKQQLLAGLQIGANGIAAGGSAEAVVRLEWPVFVILAKQPVPLTA